MKESLDDEDKYDQIEQWCLAQIQGASDVFFDPSLFRSTLRAKSMEWSFPYEVRKTRKKKTLDLLD